MSEGTVRFIQGNAACAEGAFLAGARFYAGYPITPSSEIAAIASKELPALGGVYMQMEDELGSMAAIIGASLSGVKSFTATSGPGFSLMQENLGMALMAEVPCVIINVQRFGPSTGLATKPAQGDVMQCRWGTHGDHAIIVLSPSTVQECFDLTVEAFNLSERFRTPVILLSDEVVGHMREKVIIRTREELSLVERKKPQGKVEDYRPYQEDEDGVPPMASYGDPYIFHASSSMHDETGFPNNTPENAARVVARLINKIEVGKQEIIRTSEEMVEDMDYLLIAYGATYRSAQEAVYQGREKGLRLGALKLTTLWPFPEEKIRNLSTRVKKVFVPEMNYGQVYGEIIKIVDRERVRGIQVVNSEMITPFQILEKVMEVAEGE